MLSYNSVLNVLRLGTRNAKQCRHRQSYYPFGTVRIATRCALQGCVAGRGRARAHPCPVRMPSRKVEPCSRAAGCRCGVWYDWRTGPRKSRSQSSRSRNNQRMSCRCGRGRASRQLIPSGHQHTSAHLFVMGARCSGRGEADGRPVASMLASPGKSRAPEIIIVRRTVVPTRAGSRIWTSWRACWHQCGCSWRHVKI